ncbi:MAG: hypothetical protein GWP42_14545 [Verrucomicrobiales bacterium]|jgi:hypothetical protein|nr:hypothetical protein [Verrucomicrobiales bacterium]|tara:strand:- start:8 stop:1279 length:1272 start_codon:yes stop_codon:yes gene_type:complete
MLFFRYLILFSIITFTTQLDLTIGSEPKFERQVIDDKISIGYGLAIGDVDGDKKPDILIADKSQVAWYRNGDWKRFVMTENLNPRVGTRFLDNVCIAARDINGDGKVEVAVGANWSPGETNDASKSGSVHFLIRPEDPTAPWASVKMSSHEPTVHRMHWMRIGENELSDHTDSSGDYRLLVLPLHGRGNKGGEGEPVRLLAYVPVLGDKAKEGNWDTEVVDASFHITHNFDLITFSKKTGEEVIILGGKEGIKGIRYSGKGTGESPWKSVHMVKNPLSKGVGEVRAYRGNIDDGLITAIEPFHGNELVVYTPPASSDGEPTRTVLDDSLNQGHALGLGDVLGTGKLQVVAGWRGPNKDGKVGIRIYEEADKGWKSHTLDDNGIACEDLKLSDLNGDGKLDVIAAGRGTKNVVIYWNRGSQESN